MGFVRLGLKFKTIVGRPAPRGKRRKGKENLWSLAKKER